MNNFQKLVATVGVSLFAGQAYATPVALQNLIDDPTSSISAGIFTFSGFESAWRKGGPDASFDMPLPIYADMTVEAVFVDAETTNLLFNARPNGGNPQLTIGPAVDFFDYIDMPVSFQVDIASGYVSQAVGMDLTMSNVIDNALLGSALAAIYEEVYDAKGGTMIGRQLVVQDDPIDGDILSDSVAVAGYSSFWVEKNAAVTGGNDGSGGADVAEIVGFTQTYRATAVPVPGTLMLLALGLAGVGGMQRARSQR